LIYQARICGYLQRIEMFNRKDHNGLTNTINKIDSKRRGGKNEFINLQEKVKPFLYFHPFVCIFYVSAGSVFYP